MRRYKGNKTGEYSVIESPLQEIVGRKYFALNNLNCNSSEVILIIYANKVIHEILVVVL